jgi:thiol-disulfide isomerase/thioredoxin
MTDFPGFVKEPSYLTKQVSNKYVSRIRKDDLKRASWILLIAAVPVLFSSGAAARYIEYTRSAFDGASGERRVLFFHASWCPFCKAADTEFRSDPGRIPEHTVVFKTDYDRENDLKKLYGVTVQHTFVLVDALGKTVDKWIGGGLDELKARLK